MKIRIDMIERIFLALLVLYAGLWTFAVQRPFLLKAAIVVIGAVVAVRLARVIVAEMLWRLRNRLIVAYFFIALVPIILITMLVGLGCWLVGGQLSIHLVTSELERRTGSLRSIVDYLSRANINRADWAANLGAYLETRYPGIEILISDGGRWTFPANSKLEIPPDGLRDTTGLVMRNNLLYGWAAVRTGKGASIAMFPITREFLSDMAPGIGESTILLLSENRTVLHPSPSVSPQINRIPPAVNMLDFQIWWGGPLAVSLWDKPDSPYSDVWFTIRTRPSAVLRTVFTQKLDFAGELVPMLFFSVAILFLIAELIAFLIGVSLTRTITGAVHEIYNGTLQITRGDFSHRIPIRGKDQLTELAASFNQMTENMQRLLMVEKERERLQAELEIAREVQNQLYPRNMPHLPSIRLTAVCDPARMVSGDYYDYQQLEGDKVAVAIGDVAGKGISAALLMATVQSSFRTQLRGSIAVTASAGDRAVRTVVSTSGVVSHLNKQLHADTAAEKYATFFLGVYDDASSTLTYTNAGHLPPILIRDGKAERLDVNGMVVGAFPFALYEESILKLEFGDLLVFFTDGVTEPEDAYGEMFGEERLIDLALRNAECDEVEITQLVTRAVRQWTGSSELQDDMTLLLLRRR